MPSKIRLQRFGKKGHAFYHIVVADSRAPRDGKFIERIGTYNPNSNPATIDVDRDRAMDWLVKGAQPTDTARAILSYRGVLYKYHLHKGVLKGALTEEQAQAKLEAWDAEKASKITSKVDSLGKSQQEALSKRLADEAKVREAREKSIKEKLVAATVGEVATEEAPAEDAVAEEAPVVEAAAPEAPVAEEAPATEEAPAEEAPKAEGDAPAEGESK